MSNWRRSVSGLVLQRRLEGPRVEEEDEAITVRTAGGGTARSGAVLARGFGTVVVRAGVRRVVEEEEEVDLRLLVVGGRLRTVLLLVVLLRVPELQQQEKQYKNRRVVTK